MEEIVLICKYFRYLDQINIIVFTITLTISELPSTIITKKKLAYLCIFFTFLLQISRRT